MVRFSEISSAKSCLNVRLSEISFEKNCLNEKKAAVIGLVGCSGSTAMIG